MIEWIHPGFIYIIGAPLIPLLRGKFKKTYLLLLPTISLVILFLMSRGVLLREGKAWMFSFLGYDLTLGQVDKLSILFAYIFVIASFLMILYALHVEQDGQHIAAFLYVGATLGVTFAGDLFTLFFFWEVMAWSSLFLIWYQKTKRSYEAGFRYILVHFFGGACLLGGVLLYIKTTGSITFKTFHPGLEIDWSNIASYLILLAFLINAAVPPLHAWLTDAYPEATPTGAVFLTAFTTKSAIYVLIRGFPGLEILIWSGAIMALYGVFFAVLENDIRRLLAYHIISQVGYMVSGVGMGVVGTPAGEMAINGAAAHAFSHILYKALLFMGTGAILEITGKSKLTELGGLYKSMPITFHLYMVGAYSISGFPLFNGFISKPMIIEASAMWHLPIVWLMLEGASIGTFLSTGLKLPWSTWLIKNRPACEAKEPPKNMLTAMGITAFLCFLFGISPSILYNMLPYNVNYEPYTIDHVVSISQLLLFTFLAFYLFRNMLFGKPTITIDTDWFYRMAGHRFIWFCEKPLIAFSTYVDKKVMEIVHFLTWMSRNPVLGLRINLEELILKIKVLFSSPINFKENVIKLEKWRESFPNELPILGLGVSIFLMLLVLLFYLILYLIFIINIHTPVV